MNFQSSECLIFEKLTTHCKLQPFIYANQNHNNHILLFYNLAKRYFGIHMDFLKCYQIVGVAPDCTWEELRIAYRRQVQKHHPDRYQQQPDRQLIAKERMLELNKTYDTLAEYYKKNGHLPATGLKKPPLNTALKPELRQSVTIQLSKPTIPHLTSDRQNHNILRAKHHGD